MQNELNVALNNLNQNIDIQEDIEILSDNIQELQGGILNTLNNENEPSDVDVAVAEAHLQQIAIRTGFMDSLACENVEYLKDGIMEILSLESYNYASNNREKLESINLALEGIWQSVKDGAKAIWTNIKKLLGKITHIIKLIFSTSYQAYNTVKKNKDYIKNELYWGNDPIKDMMSNDIQKLSITVQHATSMPVDFVKVLESGKDKEKIIAILIGFLDESILNMKDLQKQVEKNKEDPNLLVRLFPEFFAKTNTYGLNFVGIKDSTRRYDNDHVAVGDLGNYKEHGYRIGIRLNEPGQKANLFSFRHLHRMIDDALTAYENYNGRVATVLLSGISGISEKILEFYCKRKGYDTSVHQSDIPSVSKLISLRSLHRYTVAIKNSSKIINAFIIFYYKYYIACKKYYKQQNKWDMGKK